MASSAELISISGSVSPRSGADAVHPQLHDVIDRQVLQAQGLDFLAR
jgi:hypothetical protein